MPVKISAMPPYVGDLTGVYLPIIVPVEDDNPWVNYRMLASDFQGEDGEVMRFGFSGEDDTAAEDRAFTIPDTFSFALYNGDSTFAAPVRYMFMTSAATSIGSATDANNRTDINAYADFAEMIVAVSGVTVSQVLVSDTQISINNSTGDVVVPNLIELATINVLYYDTSTGALTYGPVADIGGGGARFGFPAEDTVAGEDRVFDITGFNFGLVGLTSGATNKALYYDTGTGYFTYDDPAIIRFGVSGEDASAAQNRLFDLNDYTFQIYTGITSEEITLLKGTFHVLVADSTTPAKRSELQLFGSAGVATMSLSSQWSGGTHFVTQSYYVDGSNSDWSINLGADPLWEVDGLRTAISANVLFYNSANGEITYGSSSGLGTTYTFSNGLTEVAGAVKLGGALTGATVVSSLSNTNLMSWTGSYTDSGQMFLVTNSSTGSALGATNNGGSSTVSFQNSGSGNVLLATANSGTAVVGNTTTGSQAAAFTNAPSSTNTTVNTLALTRNTSGTAANDIANGLQMNVEATDGSSYLATRFVASLTNATAASRVSSLFIELTDNAVNANKVEFTGGGNMKLLTTAKGYGLKSPDATQWYIKIDNAGVLSTTTTPP
jgi:hypothetical protein